MRLPEKRLEWQMAGWKLELTLCPGIWMVGIWWDGDPISVAIRFPFVLLQFEHKGGKYWAWEWTILRVIVGKQEFRTDLALNDRGLGIAMFETDDWSIHIGPISIECEFDKFYDDDLHMTPAAHLRLFSKPREPCRCELEQIVRRASHVPPNDGSNS
jgi:hypothetical protein